MSKEVKFLTGEMKDILLENGYFIARYKGDRGLCGVKRFVYTSAIVHGIDREGYEAGK